MNDLIQVTGRQPWTTSMLVAEKFGKLHKNVLRAVADLNCSNDFNALNFEPIEYKDGRGRMKPAFKIHRDGFAMLAMGFTGQQATEWKEKFIAAFNRMERALRPPRPKSLSTPMDRRYLKHLAVDLEIDHHKSAPTVNKLLGSYANVPHLRLISVADIPEVEGFAERKLAGQETEEDRARIEEGLRLRNADSGQMNLLGPADPEKGDTK